MTITKIYYSSLSIIVIICILLTTKTYAEEKMQIPVSVPIEIDTGININKSILKEKNILGNPTYDMRKDIRIPIKNQGRTDTCWTFSTLSILETNLAKTKNEYIDLSERHMEYSTSKTFLDGINTEGFNREVDSGGNALLGLAYITSRKRSSIRE